MTTKVISSRSLDGGSSTSSAENELLSIRDLSIVVDDADGPRQLVNNMQLTVSRGEIVGLVGESGSGKSLTCKAILSLLPKGVRASEGQIFLAGRDVLAMSEAEQRATRGRVVGVIPQDALTALNPVIRVGTQILETVRYHRKLSKSDATDVATELMRGVQIADPERVLRQYPHELSGGMRQRIASVIALSAQPQLLMADEPTTSLDVTVQHELILLLQDLQRQQGFGMIFVTHDLALVSNIAERIYVMRRGNLVEEGTAAEVFTNPREQYTRALLKAVPRLDEGPAPSTLVANATVGDETQPLLAASEVTKTYARRLRVLHGNHGPVRALNGVSLSLRVGEVCALVGESGSGKSTLSRQLMGVEEPDSGTIQFEGRDLTSLSHAEIREFRRSIQIVPQDPSSSLNPRLRVKRLLAEPLQAVGGFSGSERSELIAEALREVDLPADAQSRYPHQFSVGQRQRIAIARAIVVKPKLILMDEPVSSLDVSVAARILDLIVSLRDDLGVGILLVTHNLAHVAKIAQTVAVMQRGEIVEQGTVSGVFGSPQSECTRALLAAVPNVRYPVNSRTEAADEQAAPTTTTTD